MSRLIRGVAMVALRRISVATARVDARTAGRRTTLLRAQGSFHGAEIVVFTHYSRDGRPRDWEAACLDATKAAGFGVCVVLNLDSGAHSDPSWARCSDIVLERANKGRDLAAYRDAVRYLRAGGFRGSIGLANDSVLWRATALAELSRSSRARGTDIVAATESLEIVRHLQTFWIWIDGSVGQPELTRLIETWKNFRTRRAGIVYGELVLAEVAARLGLTSAALIPYETVVDELKRAVSGQDDTSPDTQARRERVLVCLGQGMAPNPTHFMWRELLSVGFPGVKRDLLRTNMPGIEDYAQIRPVAIEHGFDVSDFPSLPARQGPGARLRHHLGF